MNIIIEGCDNTGKSTLIRALLVVFPGVEVIHRTYIEDRLQVIENAKEELTEGPRIYDRSSAISETVYCSALKREAVASFDVDYIRQLVNNNIIIFCRPPFHKVVESEKEEMEGVKENMRNIYDTYTNFFRGMDFALDLCPGAYLKYDWTSEGALEALIDSILKKLGV